MKVESQNSSGQHHPSGAQMTTNPLNPPPTPPQAGARLALLRKTYRWSKTSRDIVRQNINACGTELSGVIDQLAAESGKPRWVCLRFAHRMGIPFLQRQRKWTAQEAQRLLKLMDLHPVMEISRLLRRSRSSIYQKLYRMGLSAQIGKDDFTKYTLATYLHVRPDTIERWIARGWLKARQIQTGAGHRTIIDGEDFCRFCREHTKDAVGNRLQKERIEFVYQYAFPAGHAEILSVRDSKRERAAFAIQQQATSTERESTESADMVEDLEDQQPSEPTREPGTSALLASRE